ncbi:AIPR protein [Listeria grayi]|uniref:AIPR protein n=1 Tax=Listeria grayi TaxID=1641 RepID=A0A378MKH0_LISGR|nr:AIPR family protein [Listeria grayi]STY44265.1 AIPR protein [Listeria grayi]
MASHNDYKIVAQKSKNYFKLLNVENEIPENQQARMGFYLFILECITNNKDIIEQKNCIIDTEFRSLIFNEKNNDEGVDAVYIDYETNNIKLFNFKYRESFRPNASISTGNALDSSKFLMCIYNENTENLSETTKEYVEEIIRLFSSDDTWNIELYLVSNENIGLQFNDPTIDKFKEFYDLQITSITLDDIKSFISDKPDDLSATFVTDTTSVMTYEENTFSSSKSYLVKMSVANLVRITCQSEVLRNDYNLQDLSEIKDKKIELGILYDNVRGYLGNTKFNENIMKTLDNAPSKFFMYNNGITITAKNITAKIQMGTKNLIVKLMDFKL